MRKEKGEPAPSEAGARDRDRDKARTSYQRGFWLLFGAALAMPVAATLSDGRS